MCLIANPLARFLLTIWICQSFGNTHLETAVLHLHVNLSNWCRLHMNCSTSNDVSRSQPYVTVGIIWLFLLRYSCLQLRLWRFHRLDVQLGIQIYRYLQAVAQKKRTPWLLLYRLDLRGALLLHERIQESVFCMQGLLEWVLE